VALFVLLLFFCAALSAQTVTLESVRTLLKAGRATEALQKIKELRRQNGDNPEIQLEIGKIFQELAALRAERLEQLAPDSPQAHELIGKSFESYDKLPEALAEYKRAAQKDSTLPGIHFLIGNLYWKQRDLSAATPELDAELRLNPNHSLANLRMGESLLATDADHPEKAIPHLRKAASDLRASAEAHRELGKALRMAGHYQEALTELQLAAERQPEDAKVHAQLAALYRARGNSAAAHREIEMQRQLLQRQREVSLQFHQTQPEQ
jgi:tetratricopeptide (TPR) repeat protein